MDFETYLVFAVTTAVVVLSPGATAVLIASQGAANGVWRTIFGILGIVLATVIYFVFSATGIASLIVASNVLFQIIKWVGVAYLVYLGVTAIFSKSGGLTVQPGTTMKSPRKLFTQGFIIEFANPKALLYFAAILPQFLNTDYAIAPQFLIMGATGSALQVVIYLGYAYVGDRVTRDGVKAWVVTAINRTAGAALMFAAFKMASVTVSKN